MNNQAFIDGQNLRYSTAKSDKPWAVDLKRFRVYLREKYKVDKAYYFIGYHIDAYDDLYNFLQESGYIVVFRKHSEIMATLKKGNVDTDIVFTIMRKIADSETFDKVILVSGDGDYFKMVQYLVDKNKFAKILAPHKDRMSSLYSRFLSPHYYDFLDKDSIKNKLIYRKQHK
jgi:uncharacterized LabA/DUF88 family protein